jgi:hypothetical protein
MSAQVVEYDDVTWVKPRHQSFADEVDEPWAIDGAIKRLVSENSVGSDGSDDADVLAPIGGLMIDDSLPARRAAVRWRHRDVAARLVDEDQSIRRDFSDFFDERDALVLDAFPELFRRAETLFFRVTPARCSDLSMLDLLRSTPYRARHSSLSWSSVASGITATSRSKSGNCSSLILGGNPPPAASGTTWPNSRCRRSNRETVASPTPNRCDNSKYVPSARSYAATMRRLRSNDSEFTRCYRSDPLDLFKREAV